MKKLLLLAGCLAAAGASAAAVGFGGLPKCGYADTEVSTNVPFAFARSGVRNFEFGLSFEGTPSNSVQLAFGRDADSNGALSADETDMTAGWDCGEWRMVNYTNGVAVASAPATTNLVKSLGWSLRIRRGRLSRLDVTENGIPLFAGCAEAPDPWLFDPGWNILRLTVRGVGDARESACVRLDITGFAIDLR